MVKLRAEIKEYLGKTKHSLGCIIGDTPVEIERLPVAKWLEIVEEESGIFLYHYNANGDCVADTCHQSIKEAMSQAEFEFNIKKADWREIE